MTKFQVDFPNKYFQSKEFVCRCGNCKYSDPDIIKYIADPELLNKLYEQRKTIDSPMILSRGVSCWEHHCKIYQDLYGDEWEKFVTRNSFHLVDENGYFHAVDVYYPNFMNLNFPDLPVSTALYYRFKGIILYKKNFKDRFLHQDTGFRKVHPHTFYNIKHYF